MWALSRNVGLQTDQTSFVGGKPRLPLGTRIPTCQLCGQPQTFFFQVCFPADALWNDRTLACFACTRCCNEDYLIPEMLTNHLRGCDIPADFLGSYQRNFAFLVFSAAGSEIVDDYEEQVAFFSLELHRDKLEGEFGAIGGTPVWIMEDESPDTYASATPMKFLLSINANIRFPVVKTAPPQMTLDLLGNSTLSEFRHYELFLGNAIYLFGTTVGEPLVYAITQVE